MPKAHAVFELAIEDGKVIISSESSGFMRSPGSERMTPYTYHGDPAKVIYGQLTPWRGLVEDAINWIAEQGHTVISVLPGHLGSNLLVVTSPPNEAKKNWLTGADGIVRT